VNYGRPQPSDGRTPVQQLDRRNIDYDKWDRYYTGDQPLAFLAPEVAAQSATDWRRWSSTGRRRSDSVNRRVKPRASCSGRAARPTTNCGASGPPTRCTTRRPLGQVDALVHGSAFISVWGNDEDPETPLMTFESAHQVAVEYEPGTGDRVVRAA
jgi:hypothetical protein